LKQFYFFISLIFIGCSEPSKYFSLEVREDSLSNITTSTYFNTNDIESSLLGFEAKKVHSVTATQNQSIILISKNSQNIAYVYPDNKEEKVGYIEIVHANVTTKRGLHVGMSLDEAQKKNTLTCNAILAKNTTSTPSELITCKAFDTSNLIYQFNKDSKKLQYIVLTLGKL